MRIWQKIYFVTLLLFLVMLNAGLFFAARFLFSYNLAQEKKKAETDCYFICQNLERDFSILEHNGRYRENVVELLVENYQDYYKKQNLMISLEKTGENEAPVLRSKVSGGGKRAEIYVEQNLGSPYQAYRIFYQKRLLDFEEVWRMLKGMFAAVSLVMSVLLCLILYVFMRRMLKPLGRLNEGVARIAAGEYGKTNARRNQSFWTRDEISELSRNVNKMSETIQFQIETLKDENDKKQQLMDNMAHELKTPLTSIYGYAQYLRYAKATEEERREGLMYIMEESGRLARMSETMLTMRLYEKEERKLEKVSLQVVAARLQKILAGKLQEKNLTIRMEFEEETVFAEETLVIGLFQNLLENAIRASNEGDEVVFRSFCENDKQVFEVIDYGIGMEEAELERITEAFYRVDKARSRKDGGVGLGLSIVDLIVKRLGGAMAFTSAPGKGTKATVILQLPNKDVKSL